ncbi:MAG: AraC family ligand binding domain-containing protein [Acidobacteria bacterium]|nr:AraC family ligand binding domain-containing protein [Acidobacteriota bacterium]
MKIHTLLLAIFCLGVAQAQAPTEVKFVHLSAEHLKGYAEKLKAREPTELQGKKNMIANEHFELHDNFSFYEVRRDEDGLPEQHARWHDIFIVQQGSGAVLYGGKAEGIQPGNAPGEGMGGKMVGGHMQRLVAGDMAIIPAGIPHQVNPDKGKSITYMVLKVEKK